MHTDRDGVWSRYLLQETAVQLHTYMPVWLRWYMYRSESPHAGCCVNSAYGWMDRVIAAINLVYICRQLNSGPARLRVLVGQRKTCGVPVLARSTCISLGTMSSTRFARRNPHAAQVCGDGVV